ncbi:glycerol-3-phosphate dehydrogenase/oxidase [bacterium]|nr:glycerol-3-phosphate dehydrogenase/oxidase [bacterium]
MLKGGPSNATGAIASRAAQLDRLSRETFDLAIIGGGINGAAIARDAAMRGLKVALVDRGDFAGATSSHSSKLIHGGLRYLPQGQIRLVYRALRERELLRHLTAPHLVRPMHFLFPFYRSRRPGRLAVSAGLVLYDLFARLPPPERHRRLGAGETLAAQPALAADGLTGGAIYFDAWGDDARLTLENAIDAALHGAAAANYVALEGFDRLDGKITAAGLRDLIGAHALELRARIFINAAGPWADELRRLDDPRCAPRIRLTKGVHLVVNESRLPLREALTLTDAAGRIVFAIPHGEWILVGTTDTDYAGNPAEARPDSRDIDYLLGVINRSMPGLGLTTGDVVHSFAGLRALPAGGLLRPSAVSREEIVVESPSGLLTVAGGKLTTHREIGEMIVDRCVNRLGLPARKSTTRTAPLPGARHRGMLADGRSGEAPSNKLNAETRAMLAERYGTRAAMVETIAQEHPDLAERLAPGVPAICAEVIHAARNEMAMTTADFLIRRTAMTWRNPPAAQAAAPAVARLLASELGWDERGREADLSEFFAAAGQTHYSVEAAVGEVRAHRGRGA